MNFWQKPWCTKLNKVATTTQKPNKAIGISYGIPCMSDFNSLQPNGAKDLGQHWKMTTSSPDVTVPGSLLCEFRVDGLDETEVGLHVVHVPQLRATLLIWK